MAASKTLTAAGLTGADVKYCRRVVENTIEELIDLLDILDAPVEDMEEDDPSGHDGLRLTEDDENSLGSTDDVIQTRAWASGSDRWWGNHDLELDLADREPTLGAPEKIDQTLWADGDNSHAADDCEDQNEDGTDLDRGERDLSDDEPSLGSLDAQIDQGVWSTGNTMDYEIEDRSPRSHALISRLPISNLEQVRPGVLPGKGGAHV